MNDDNAPPPPGMAESTLSSVSPDVKPKSWLLARTRHGLSTKYVDAIPTMRGGWLLPG